MSTNAQLTPMTFDQIAPELRESIQRVPRTPVSSALGRWMARNGANLLLREKQHEGIRTEKRKIDNGITLRIYTPDTRLTDAALLWIHGGGMVIGSAKQDDLFCAETARELGMIVVSTEYRLAPEFPFPAPLNDCYGAWKWLQTSADQLMVDPSRVAIGGQSAGGGLAASLVQRIHDTGGIQPMAQWLFCPMLDDRTAAKRELDLIAHKVWDNQQNFVGWKAFLGTHPGAEQVPDYAVSARRDNLRGLPPTWIGVGDIELFFDEDRTYAERLSATGVDCTLDVVPGAPHGFENINVAGKTQLAQSYLSRARQWLGQKLAHNR
jgi:acetyl esterase/lipase